MGLDCIKAWEDKNRPNCLIGLINGANLVIFKFTNSNFGLKDNFINKEKTQMISNF